jgi:hypothetical protein
LDKPHQNPPDWDMIQLGPFVLKEFPSDLAPGEMVSDAEYEITAITINGSKVILNPPVHLMPGDKISIRDVEQLALADTVISESPDEKESGKGQN